MSNAHMKVGPDYFRIIAHFERGKANDPRCRLTSSGAALDAYLCPADVATIGAGSIKRLDGSPVQMGDTVSEEEVFLLAERDAKDAADAVRKIKRPLKQHQFDAYTAFTHNLGEGNFRKIAPLIEAGRWEDVAEKMGEYVRAWGRYDGRWYYMALLGLKIRRSAEALLSLGLDWPDAANADNIGMPKRREWQPEGIAKDGSKGRYFDVLLPGATEFTTLEGMAPPLPSLTVHGAPKPQSELILTTPAPAPAPAPAIEKPSATVSGPVEAAPVKPTEPVAPQLPPKARPAPAPVVLPSQAPRPPRLPDPPVPIGQQREAVDATRNSQDWSSNAKAMWQSRRFWGLVLVLGGRLWMLKTGSNAVLGTVSDPLITEMFSGFMVMIIGEVIQHWGERKATRPLK